MAKLRRNHGSGRGSGVAGSILLRVLISFLIIVLLVVLYRRFVEGQGARPRVQYDAEAYFLPTGFDGEVVHHTAYSLGYDEAWEQAAWVAYILRGADLRRQWTERRDNFRPDPLVSTGSADEDDYRGSGFDRGHLAPFADFAYDAMLADETFYMSNVSPQDPGFNRGIWRELEELTREWAERSEKLYVVAGPVVTGRPRGYVGREIRVAVPRMYYKVVLDPGRGGGIGFLMPNTASDKDLADYIVSIDRVEEATGLDFFGELLPDEVEARIEAWVNLNDWAL